MNNIGVLYRFELKKILERKMVWGAGIVMLIFCIFISISGIFGSSYIAEENKEISGYEMIIKTREGARALSGRAIDSGLLAEMAERGEDAEKEYTALYSYVQEIVDGNSFGVLQTAEDDVLDLSADEEHLYSIRKENIAQVWGEQMLTDGEIAYWEDKEAKIKTPFIYHYAEGWMEVFNNIYALNFMLLLFLAFCLSGVFSMEHIRKTDQLILCSRYGKKQLYLAKILAGITFGVISAILLFWVSIVTSILLYGADGFFAALQLVLPLSSWPVSIGTAVMILFALFIIVSIFYSMIVMFLSECMKSSAAVMAVLTGCMIFTMLVDIPYWLRSASQAYDLLPTNLLVKWELWDGRLFSFFGTYVTNFQFAAVVYLILSVVLVVTGRKIYEKCQVNAR